MAVTQVSTIQIRYGLQSDITTLAAGEMAWAIDTQKLYIGNGSVEEGAPFPGITEIQTGQLELSDILGNYTYKGTLGGYQVITGVDSLTPTTRLFQDKLDDFVNVRDFGAIGNGIVDDTAAIQRAIYELYNRNQPYTTERTRRVIRFNAGIYKVDGNLYVPPYVTFLGEGKLNTQLKFSASAVILTTTTGGDSAAEINIGEYPRAVFFQKMSLESLEDNDVVLIDGAKDIVFEDVRFKGPKVESRYLDAGGSGVRIKSTAVETSGIHFHRCTFTGTVHAALVDSEVSVENVNFVDCDFDNLFDGVRVDNYVTPPKNIKISNSVFNNVFTYAIDADVNVSNVISTGNRYKNVGSKFEGDTVAGTDWTAVLRLKGKNNYSIGDIFDRTIEVSQIFPRIESSEEIYSLSVDSYLRFGAAYQTPGKKIQLISASSGVQPISDLDHGIITYSIIRGSDYRTGTIQLAHTTPAVEGSAEIVYNDEYVITKDIGVDLRLERTDGILYFAWDVSADIDDAVLSYQIKKLQ